MEMDVPDELSGTATVIIEYVIALGVRGGDDRLGDWSDFANKSGSNLGGAIVQTLVMFLRDYEAVPIAERADIQKGQDSVVLKDHASGDIAFNDFAENALVGHGKLLSH